ncbi:CHRD domain-containing protein [Candidatus Nitrosocosmicus arcticus]|uniref:CHRD domain-containing protein n=1 Tax=Candidatus Nitrosocosmicus arcticus TaxID=2035267 RepID=UPI0011A426E9|nr:CHRD domain-containing protein [Candidatus Nitrosocosmicus arcticus]
MYAQIFVTELTGEEQPLPTNTNAFGNIIIIGNNDTLQYDLYAEDLANVKHIGIHQGDSDEHGKVVVSLFETKNPVGVPIVDLAGNITNEDLKGPMTDATINDLVGNMTEGNDYVNIQTSDFPLGEIRGQLSLQEEEDDEEPNN